MISYPWNSAVDGIPKLLAYVAASRSADFTVLSSLSGTMYTLT